MLFTFLQNNDFQVPSLTIWILAWIFLIVGLLGLTILIVYTRYGRELSIKLSILSITFAAVFLGFAFHFFLISFGI
ncbi:MAG: hypothetical protein CEE42_10680 [Promethearchaeota archaeon Loki_b31]|nr:MAG: hypothetical protein CEE42_10680 [Candidatus Lokiarchaeota archaeon Loki_b31]